MRSLATVALVLLLAAPPLGCSSAASATNKPEPAGAAEAKKPRTVTVDAETAKRLGITTMVVGQGGLAESIPVPGSVEYDLNHYAEVGPRLDGRITAVKGKLGDSVKKGQVLATIAVPTLAEAQAGGLTANASLEAALKNYNREKDLLAKQLTTARELEVAEAELKKAKAEVAASQARLLALGVGGQAIGGQLELVAPIDGMIVQRHAVVGGFLATSANAYVIADTSKLTAVLEVHEADLPYLKLGASVTITADSLPDLAHKGTLTWIDPVVSKTTRLVRARVDLPNDSGTLRPGMFVRGRIVIALPAGSGIILPSQAVQPLGADDVVFVLVSPGHYDIRKVVVGRRTSEIVEVKEGAAKGDTIVVEGAFLLRGEAAKQ
ncbi:MAG: efflux RND transporter periplasmic adaptor subunit [Myxococcales bacterium]|nr:efflux RND transporter periplasmic adaptor subunit [Myxococcales bacterium]